MQRIVMGVALITIACGDNSEQCGPGTTSIDHVCVPSGTCGTGTRLDASGLCLPDGSVVCTDGTKFDTTLGACVVDPAACQDGTVLVNGACADPTAGLVIDVEEGPEPNGAGIIEDSVSPAGLVPQLKDVGGSGIVLHGFIAPFRDADLDGLLDPDVDTYKITVTGPTLVKVTADGVHGALGGFAVFANVGAADPLTSYERFGFSLTGDSAKRSVFLPRAGEYLFVIGDSRTFYQYTTGGPLDAAPGDGEYYVTIDQLSPVAPTMLTVTGGTATSTGMFASDETKFFGIAMGGGTNTATLAMPYVQSRGALVVINGTAFVTSAMETGTPAQAAFSGFTSGATGVVAADPAYNSAGQPVPYTLTVTVAD